eukprot:c3032_g1_i1.p1 GENE.c3032_g1_i1~~c3032_g1_i1.p1  ORF type:complete len:144 (+),score=42.34 c3032_g1_i1:28-432(+)
MRAVVLLLAAVCVASAHPASSTKLEKKILSELKTIEKQMAELMSMNHKGLEEEEGDNNCERIVKTHPRLGQYLIELSLVTPDDTNCSELAPKEEESVVYYCCKGVRDCKRVAETGSSVKMSLVSLSQGDCLQKV